MIAQRSIIVEQSESSCCVIKFRFDLLFAGAGFFRLDCNRRRAKRGSGSLFRGLISVLQSNASQMHRFFALRHPIDSRDCPDHEHKACF